LFARLGAGDSIGRLLIRSGASFADAGTASALISAAAPAGIAPGTSIDITLGRKDGAVRSIERLSLRAALDLRLVVERGGEGLKLTRIPIRVDDSPLRIRGRVGDGLYWSLRAAGVTPATAQEYLRALGTQLDVSNEVGPDDRFDLVVANRRAATGENVPGPLLYAGMDRIGARDFQFMKWSVGGRSEWLEASGVGRQTSGVIWPVNAPITSGFGARYHPILHFTRMHAGIDFGARWGTPIVATADGQVTRAGWAGGYGRQVRITHSGGMDTSYSHMSRITVYPGEVVRQGQLIGYVGSTGLSTGPHLHYEVRRNGTPINPMSVRFVTRSQLEGPQLEAFRSRLRSLLSIGLKQG
jgi:murein DD-endopeptidase MepM/ murein hydrolase activator NlpD